MCYFLTLGVTEKARSLLPTFFARGFALHGSDSKSTQQVLPAGYQPMIVTSGMCSCDFYTNTELEPVDPVETEKKLSAKFRQRGWSEAKIARAVAESVKNHKPLATLPFRGLRPDVAEKVVQLACEAGPVALIVHFYSGDVDAEKFAVQTGKRYDQVKFLDAAHTIPEDTVVWIAYREQRSGKP